MADLQVIDLDHTIDQVARVIPDTAAEVEAGVYPAGTTAVEEVRSHVKVSDWPIRQC